MLESVTPRSQEAMAIRRVGTPEIFLGTRKVGESKVQEEVPPRFRLATLDEFRSKFKIDKKFRQETNADLVGSLWVDSDGHPFGIRVLYDGISYSLQTGRTIERILAPQNWPILSARAALVIDDNALPDLLRTSP